MELAEGNDTEALNRWRQTRLLEAQNLLDMFDSWTAALEDCSARYEVMRSVRDAGV
jgi:hypothetical protein